ncbi:MAG: hypothetical protein JRI66_13505 [Deltaproteobacteria bacterium]|nr:hypothetical protein [Deltaproteobacteria bacterium]
MSGVVHFLPVIVQLRETAQEGRPQAGQGEGPLSVWAGATTPILAQDAGLDFICLTRTSASCCGVGELQGFEELGGGGQLPPVVDLLLQVLYQPA